jgi:hypothetical protein
MGVFYRNPILVVNGRSYLNNFIPLTHPASGLQVENNVQNLFPINSWGFRNSSDDQRWGGRYRRNRVPVDGRVGECLRGCGAGSRGTISTIMTTLAATTTLPLLTRRTLNRRRWKLWRRHDWSENGAWCCFEDVTFIRDHVIKTNGSLGTTNPIFSCSTYSFHTKFWDVLCRYISYNISKKGNLNLCFRWVRAALLELEAAWYPGRDTMTGYRLNIVKI